jgi:phosphoribosylglycinamide formyltransferase 2
MTNIGTPFSKKSTKAILLGSGELGKEVAIELKRYGIEVIAVDNYPNAPAMQIADRNHIISMQDPKLLREVIEKEKPDYIIPEVEAISTKTLLELEGEGFNIIPSAKATHLTMNREGIRSLASEKLELPTSPYRFATNLEELKSISIEIGFPSIVKPIMSSSGKGQSTLKSENDIETAWKIAQEGARGKSDTVILEGFVDFDYEITLLTIQHKNGVSFCKAIGHRQEDGDYQESWQPQEMPSQALEEAKRQATLITGALGGWGLFGVEFFIKGDQVIFSELSPRPHDTGMVTLISQNQSEFALHVRAILGLPIPNIRFNGPSASAVILAKGYSKQLSYSGLEDALLEEDTQIKIFGKPEVQGERRMGVALALDENTDLARAKAIRSANKIKITLN